MWTYHQDDLERRLQLTEDVGFVIDHWLFLHADETHAVWSSRPIGLRFLAETALSSNGPRHKVLLQGVGRELSLLGGIGHLFPTKVPTETPVDTQKGEINLVWKRWLEEAESQTFRQGYLNALASEIEDAICKRDYGTATFLLRKASAEVAGDDTALNAIVSQSLQATLRSSKPVKLTGLLNDLLFPSEDELFEVQFGVTSVQIPSAVVSKARNRAKSALVIDENSEEPNKLIALKVEVSAHHPTQAIHLGLPKVRQILEQFKIRHYVRVTLHGSVMVSQLRGCSEPKCFSLAEPFGSGSGFVRPLPKIPGAMKFVISQLEPTDREPWKAAVWHVSNAISLWPEDTHAAASEIWQGLESFAGSRKEVVNTLVNEYLAEIPNEILSLIARKIYKQRDILRVQTGSCDWKVWNEQKISLKSWVHSVRNPKSSESICSWGSPKAPLILSEEVTGLLATWEPALRSGSPPKWAKERTLHDLDLLYGMRNAAVHSGTRVGNQRLAAYLGRVGLEMLLTTMVNRVSGINQSTGGNVDT